MPTVGDVINGITLPVPCEPGTVLEIQIKCNNEGTGWTATVEEGSESIEPLAGGCGGGKAVAAKVSLLEKLAATWKPAEVVKLAEVLFPKPNP